MNTRRLPLPRLALASLLALPLSLSADELQGADAILRRLAANAEAPAASSATDEVAQFKTLLATYRRESPTLAPEAAAIRWLALFDGFARLPSEPLYRLPYHERLSVAGLVEALPPPDAWDALAAAIATRTESAGSPRELGLRVLGAILAGDNAAQAAAVERLTAAIKADKKLESYELESLLESAERISAAVAASAGDPARLAAFERELAKHEAPASARSRYQLSSLAVPDLVRFAGRPAAEPLLLRALRLDTEFQLWSTGEHTRRALAELALKNIDQLKRPHWTLVASLDDVALFEALDRKFPATSATDDERRSATLVYLLGLVAAGRTADATALVFDPATRFGRDGLSFGYGSRDLFAQLQRAGRGDAVVDFLASVLTRDPALPFWDGFISVAAQQSRAKEALALLRTVLAKPDLPAGEASALRARLVEALLAADELDEGLALLRSLVAEDRRALAAASAPAADSDLPSSASPASPVPSLAELQALGVDLPADVLAALQSGDASFALSAGPAPDAADRSGQRVQRVATLLELGRLLEKPELVDEGLAAGRDFLPRFTGREAYQRGNLVEVLVKTYETQNRLDEAESLLLEHLLRLQSEEKGEHRSSTQAALLRLAAVYDRAGRHADVLRVFTGSPDLGAADLSELPMSSCSQIEVSAHLTLVDALLAAQRTDEARRILHRIVHQQPGCDAAYARLEKLGGPDYAAFLDEAARLDRFEERPLIWKARLQLAAGDLPAAEQTIRAAIAIDPSDGEQGKNDRMRAYAVLGDILEKRGDADQAALMRGAVAAIRLSEQADDWWSAGLLTRAVRLYEQSLLKFADAYCIQSRLALRYNELGDAAKAEEHYRRAFELMPESFGRVESHCFGCEGAFNGPRAQNIADKVFTRLAAEPSPRPQVFYLLGYLRSSQERPDDAAQNFRKAVALDPDYLNAWDKLQDLAGAVYLPAAEREAAALALLRLDPEGKRTHADFDGFTDFRKLWGALLAAEASLPPEQTGPLFEFAAAKAKRDARQKDENDFGSYSHWSNQPRNLRERLSQADVFSSTAQLIEQTLRR